MVTTKDMVQVYVYLRLLSTTDNFMSVDRKAFKTAVWEALDGTKKIHCFIPDSLRIAVPKQPVSRNQFQKI